MRNLGRHKELKTFKEYLNVQNLTIWCKKCVVLMIFYSLAIKAYIFLQNQNRDLYLISKFYISFLISEFYISFLSFISH